LAASTAEASTVGSQGAGGEVAVGAAGGEVADGAAAGEAAVGVGDRLSPLEWAWALLAPPLGVAHGVGVGAVQAGGMRAGTMDAPLGAGSGLVGVGVLSP
jgi:hypothetical protein